MDNKWFSYKNIPNSLSLLRILLVLPFILIIYDIFVYECTKNLGLVIIFFTIIASDIADGYLARKLKCTSKAGAQLDVISDTVYTILSLTAFAYFKIIPVWFIFIMVLKLIEFIITSKLINQPRRKQRGMVVRNKELQSGFNTFLTAPRGGVLNPSARIKEKQNSEKPLIFDKIGKISVCIVMLLPGIFVFRCIIIDYKIVMNVTIYIITIMLLLSFINRIKSTIEFIKV